MEGQHSAFSPSASGATAVPRPYQRRLFWPCPPSSLTICLFIYPAHNTFKSHDCFMQELTFEVGPCSEEALQLHAALYRVTPDEAGADDFVAGGR